MKDKSRLVIVTSTMPRVAEENHDTEVATKPTREWSSDWSLKKKKCIVINPRLLRDVHASLRAARHLLTFDDEGRVTKLKAAENAESSPGSDSLLCR